MKKFSKLPFERKVWRDVLESSSVGNEAILSDDIERTISIDSESFGRAEFDRVHTGENINFTPNIDSAMKREEIKSWVFRNNICHTALKDLFHILNRTGVKYLPLSVKTLTSINRKEI